MTDQNKFEPNPKQAEAITGSGIQLVLAGPGSGKTRVITEKILHMIEKEDIKQEEILALTFSEKAAAEMAERLEEKTDISRLTIATFHSFCLEVLEDNILDTGISFGSGLISRTSQLVWGMKNIDNFGFESIEVGNNGPSVIESIIDGISRFRDELITADDLEKYLEKKRAGDLSEDEAAYLGKLSDLLKVYREYGNYRRSEGLLDFDDMIHETVELLRNKPDIKKQYQNRFRYVLVDEFQDTNYAQLELVKLLANDNLCIVGDDDQSIYRFRGAYDGNVDEFAGHYPGHIQVILEENYRNPGTILRVARQLMACANGSCTKNLKPRSDGGEPVAFAECENENVEAGWVADEIESLINEGFMPAEIAILCRKRSEGEKYHEILGSRNIPCDFTGDAAFFTIPAIKDAVSYLKAVANPHESGIALNRMMRQAGVPEASIREINIAARRIGREDGRGDGVFEAMKGCEPAGEQGTIIISEIAGNVELLSAERHTMTLPSLVHGIILRTGRLYRKENEDRESIAALGRLYEIALEFSRINPAGEMDDLLEHLSLLRDISGDFEVNDEAGSGVKIMTVHQSKGKEFPVVFVTDLSDRHFPLNYRSKPFYVPADLSKGIKAGEDEKELYKEEERRLFYVAMTRASGRLYLTRAKRYGNNKRDSKPSVFLEEIDYLNNPDIKVIAVEAGEAETDTGIAAEGDPFSEEKKLLNEALAAIADKRYRSAMERILFLEYFRCASGEDIFDKDAFLDIPFEEPEISAEKEPLIKSGEDIRLSASALKTYDDCPLKFKFEKILLIPGEPKTFFSLGTSAHSIIEHLTKMKMGGVRPSMELAEELLERFWSPDAYLSKKHEEEDRERIVRHLENYLEWENNNPNTPVETEMKFEIKVHETPFTGYIDRLEKTRSGYAVVDYKTSKNAVSKNAAKTDIQLNLYALAIREKTGKLPEKVSLFYLDSGKFVDYIPDEDSISAFLDNAGAILDRIFTGDFDPKESHNCQYCDYRILCGD